MVARLRKLADGEVLAPGELIARNVVMLIPPRLRGDYAARLQNYLTTGIRQETWGRAELTGQHRDGGSAEERGEFRHVVSQCFVVGGRTPPASWRR